MGTAQVKVVERKESPKIELCKVYKDMKKANDCAWVYLLDGDVFFETRTTNQFDDDFIYYLGDDIESAVVTLKDLVALIEENDIGTEFVIDFWKGEECRAFIADWLSDVTYRPNTVGRGSKIVFQHNDYAGFAVMQKKALQSMIGKLQGRMIKESRKNGKFQ